MEGGLAGLGWAKGRPDNGAAVKIAWAILPDGLSAGRRWELGLDTMVQGFAIAAAERCVAGCNASNHRPRSAPDYCLDAAVGLVVVQEPSRLAQNFGHLPDYRKEARDDCCGVGFVEGDVAEGYTSQVPECPVSRCWLGVY